MGLLTLPHVVSQWVHQDRDRALLLVGWDVPVQSAIDMHPLVAGRELDEQLERPRRRDEWPAR